MGRLSREPAAKRAERFVLRLLGRCSHPRKLPLPSTQLEQRPEFRAVFISDVHLGLRASQVDRLCRFLETTTMARLYLVGDIVDLIALERTGRFHGDFRQVTSLIRRLAARGTRILLIPGNHDAALRRYVGQTAGALHHEMVHADARGRRLLVTHGDEADAVVTFHPLLSRIGSAMYDGALEASRVVNWLRRLAGLEYWNLAGAVKRAVKLACTYIGDWEATIATRVHSHGLDGVICGHIHVPRIGEIQGRAYYNCGDWVEHGSALAETWEGEFRLLSGRLAHQPERAATLRLRFNLGVRSAGARLRRSFLYRLASSR